jgi:tRNA (guanine-N7-)-methyltransferase
MPCPSNGREESHGGSSNSPSQVEFADVGCGFGGLLVKLSPLYPDTLMLGMELRDKVITLPRASTSEASNK